MFDNDSHSMALLKRYKQAKEMFEKQKDDTGKLEEELSRHHKSLTEDSSCDDDRLNGYIRAKQRIEESRAQLNVAKERFEKAETALKEILSDFKNKAIVFRSGHYSHQLVTYHDDETIEIK